MYTRVQNFECFGPAPVDTPIAEIAQRPPADGLAAAAGRIAAERIAASD
jgi:hypothetical protein